MDIKIVVHLREIFTKNVNLMACIIDEYKWCVLLSTLICGCMYDSVKIYAKEFFLC